ncbi:MAG: hypothetical protein M3Z95_03375, partial [Actinomycetota bacterium]|nr:hypothetical protein [Actinomycetota bacterium]
MAFVGSDDGAWNAGPASRGAVVRQGPAIRTATAMAANVVRAATAPRRAGGRRAGQAWRGRLNEPPEPAELSGLAGVGAVADADDPAMATAAGACERTGPRALRSAIRTLSWRSNSGDIAGASARTSSR